MKREKEATDGALAQAKAAMSSLESSVGTMKDRSEELTAESAKLQEEKRKLVESLAVAQRESAEAAKKIMQMRASGGGGGDSEFTADQLATQVSVLKGRLACPVCNHRDKACILLRCRHMFCKPCVEENVKVCWFYFVFVLLCVVDYKLCSCVRLSLLHSESKSQVPRLWPEI